MQFSEVLIFAIWGWHNWQVGPDPAVAGLRFPKRRASPDASAIVLAVDHDGQCANVNS
jgi:hypothetical protein